MKKKFVVCIIIAVTLVLGACAPKNLDLGELFEKESTKPHESQETETTQVDFNKESVQFWISTLEAADEIVMTPEEIKAQNRLMMEKWGKDYVSGYYDMLSFPETIDGQWIRERVTYMDYRNIKLFHKGEAVTDAKWDTYFAGMNLENIDTTLRYGLVVHHASSLDVPTTDILTNSGMDEDFNRIQQTSFKIGEPLLILHESADRAWLYVMANEYIGWVEGKNVAFFKDRQSWLEYQNAKDFIIVTEDNGIASATEKLFLGTKLLRKAEGVALLPVKDVKGNVSYIDLHYTEKDKVHEGYLPYTRKAVLELAFSMLGDPYGWGGAEGKRDCSSFIKDIYSCFGLRLPRNSGLQMQIPMLGVDTSQMDKAGKQEVIDNARAGDIIGFKGHVMLYLGSAKGQDYVINMLSSYVPEHITENFGAHAEELSQVFVNTLDVHRGNGNTWLQEILAVICFE